MLEIGKTVKVVPQTFGEYNGSGVSLSADKKIKGTVVYIHPEGRYYTVDFGRGCTESFIITDLHVRAAILARSRRGGYVRGL